MEFKTLLHGYGNKIETVVIMHFCYFGMSDLLKKKQTFFSPWIYSKSTYNQTNTKEHENEKLRYISKQYEINSKLKKNSFNEANPTQM